MLSEAYLLAKICFGAAENEPAKNLQKLLILLILLSSSQHRLQRRARGPLHEPERRPRRGEPGRGRVRGQRRLRGAQRRLRSKSCSTSNIFYKPV